MSQARITRVRLRNYRSIASCDVSLGPLTFLAGPNGSGKSNFLDALRLVRDGLTSSLEKPLADRGGFDQVVHRSSAAQMGELSIQLEVELESGRAEYELTLAGDPRSVGVQREVCRVEGIGNFERRTGSVMSSEPVLPVPPPSRLYLVTAANLPVFQPVFDALSRAGFYSINPEVIRYPQTRDSGDLLQRDGRNLASVLQRMAVESPKSFRAVADYLGAAVPGFVDLGVISFGTQMQLLFTRRDAENFPATSMSDGTLRALGVLVAVFQHPVGAFDPPLVGIEEPESAIHPAAAAVIREALQEASVSRQIVVTSHSPELLDEAALDPESIVAVRADGDGATMIGRPDAAARMALRDHLYTAGELLRIDQLLPEIRPGIAEAET